MIAGATRDCFLSSGNQSIILIQMRTLSCMVLTVLCKSLLSQQVTLDENMGYANPSGMRGLRSESAITQSRLLGNWQGSASPSRIGMRGSVNRHILHITSTVYE